MTAKRANGVKSILSSQRCKEEIMECNEHEIVCRLSTFIGKNPCDLKKAEEIFYQMKYEIARFVITHEYSSRIPVNEELIIWLDEKTSPEVVARLAETIEKYLE
jgi:hypothetical protein